MKEVVRVWIGNPYEKGRFNGTAFFIDAQTLVTAKHVVTNREGEVYENIFLGNTPDGGIIPIDKVKLCQRDLAILTVKKSFTIDATPFTKEIKEENEVTLIGFYDNGSSQKTYKNRISGYQSSEHTYELQNHLTNGLSGSPVLLNGKICGVAKAINVKKNLTYVIPITELCMEIDDFFKTKKAVKKKLTLEQWASITGILGTLIALGAWLFEPNYDTPQEEPSSIIEVQTVEKSLEGIVSDMDGKILDNVNVWEEKTGRSTKTDNKGHYLLEYTEYIKGEEIEVTFSKLGYNNLTRLQEMGKDYDIFLEKEEN